MSFILRMNFCAAIVVPVIMAALGAAGAREFRVADTQAEDYPTVLALQFMARIVEERTAGRHRIRVFHSRQLGEEKDTIEQTRVGAIDLNRTNVAPIGSLIPAANVLALLRVERAQIRHRPRSLGGARTQTKRIERRIRDSFQPERLGRGTRVYFASRTRKRRSLRGRGGKSRTGIWVEIRFLFFLPGVWGAA